MKHFYSVILLLLSVSAFAQTTITGKITDGKGEGLPGVSVALKGTSTGVISDVDGGYSISAPADGTLVFSFIGFKTLETPINGNLLLNATLEEDIKALEEVVVIGYGVQKKSVATAAISKVDHKSLQGFSTQRVEQTLQGQVSGVIVKPSSGQPGSSMNIMIRGIGTNGSNSPLIIIDGMNANDGALSALNPSDIESIQILKDAASAAIYGARAANGVVLVTTKKAKSGEAQLSYGFFFGTQNPWRMPTMLNAPQYVELISEKYANSGQSLPTGFPTSSDDITTNSNWLDKIVEPGKTQTHQISLAKGTESGHINASLSYYAQDGIIAPEKSNARRITGRFSTEQKINDFLTFGENALYVHATNERIGENNVFGSPISEAMVYDPLTPFYDPNGTFGFAQSPFVQKEYLNPLSQIFITNNSSIQNEIIGNAYLKVTPLKGLTLRSDLAIDYAYYTGKGFTPSYTFFDTQGNQLNITNELNDIYEYSSKNFISQWENYGTYSKSFGKHTGEITLGTTLRQQTGSSFGASSSGIPDEVQLDPNFQYIDNTPDSLRRSNSSAPERVALASVFGRLIYNYDERYLVTAILRRDGSTVFGSNNRYGLFPSLALGWVVSREAFWNIEPVSFLKLRASYGVNGNDRIGSLRYVSIVSQTGVYPFGKPGSQTIYNGISSPYPDNPNIKWEQSIQFDIGLEIGLLNDQITMEMDYYTKTTSGLLMGQTTPSYHGANQPTANVGEIVNKGFELEVRYNQNFGDVLFGAGLNLTTLTNNVTKVVDDGYIDGYTWPVRNTVITRMEVGQPMGYFRGFKTAGIFNNDEEVFSHINADGDLLQPNAQAGDIKYVDVNKDGVIDNNDITKIGSPWAKVQLGLNLTAAYKGFDLRLLFTSSIGNDIFRSYERQDVVNNNYSTEWLDRWTPENTNASYPRLTTTDPNNNSRASDFYVEDGSYVRLKTLQIGYAVPKPLLEKVKLRSLRAYLTFDNLWTLTGYSGFDPEIGNSGWILDTGIDKGFYPQMKTMGFGIDLSF